MRFSYANVMSTIAMFAAVTTGTGYAAAQLGANTVRTTHIKNGQVTLSDLHPSVRKKMSGTTTARPPAGGTGTGTAPKAWTNRGLLSSAISIAECDPGPCGAITGLELTSTTLPSGAKPAGVKFRILGSITNIGEGSIQRPTVSLYFADTTPVPSSANYRQLQCDLSASVGDRIAAGQTVEVTEAWCPDMNRVVTGKHMRLKVTADSATGGVVLRNNLRLEYAAG